MKLTTMRGDAALVMLCDLIAPATRIIEDAVTAEALRKISAIDGRKMPPALQYAAIAIAVEPVLRAHSEDIFAIAAALIGKDSKTTKAQPLMQTVQEVKAVWDEELRGFFTSSGASAAEE